MSNDTMNISPDPVQRLLSFLEQALKEKPVATWQVFSAVLQLDCDTPASFVRWYSDIVRLYDDAVTRVRDLPDLDESLHLKWLDPVAEVLVFTKIFAGFQGVREPLSETVMQSLRFSAHESRRHPQPEEVLSHEFLLELTSEVNDLYEKVLDGDLGSDLKTLLTVQLESIRQSLIAYRIRGAVALEHALERAVGATVLHWDLIEDTDHEEVGRFRNLMGHLHKALDVALKVKQIAEPFVKLLASGA